MIERQSLELALPGASIGAGAGALAGGLTLLAGQPAGLVALSALSLAVPLAFFGGLYGVLLGHGVFRPGTFGPVGLYWIAGFPLSRLVQESLTGIGLADGVLPFLAYQAMLSLGFAIGFLWLHERFMPPWLLRHAEGNPRAETLLSQYISHAEQMRPRSKKGARR
ncbi:hypothetical protein [Nonomuraea sp. LPB2021202275-12-8]|uniref:hypothetical protein n=1 Tax=Nonomuraea sp. LPB2021202275-12-8 TaxID=3120159 RepID=UPI00300C5A7B